MCFACETGEYKGLVSFSTVRSALCLSTSPPKHPAAAYHHDKIALNRTLPRQWLRDASADRRSDCIDLARLA
jgi:hypothetical protein